MDKQKSEEKRKMNNNMHLFVLLVILTWTVVFSGCTPEKERTPEKAQSVEKTQPLVEMSKEIIGYSPNEEDKGMAEKFLRDVNPDISELSRAFRGDEYSFRSLTKELKGSEKFRIFLLYFTRFPVQRGLTDDGLYSKTRGGSGKRVKKMSQIFSSSAVVKCMYGLDDLAPDTLSEVIGLLAGVYYIGYNPHSSEPTTWAANSLSRLTTDIMFAELACGSVAAKLLVHDGDLKILKKTQADFRWSGRPSIEILLPSPDLGVDDIPRLKKLLNSKHKYYREAAVKALKRLEKARQ